MAFLQAVGRARPATEVRQALSQRARDMREEQRFGYDMALRTEQIKNLRRQGQIQDQQIQEMNMPVSMDIVAGQYEGGANSPMFKMVYDLAKSQGMVEQGAGLGTISRRNFAQLGELMKDPAFLNNFSRTRIDYWTNQVQTLQKVASGDPEAKKAFKGSAKDLEMKLNRAQQYLQRALWESKAYADSQKNKLEERRTKAYEQRTNALNRKTLESGEMTTDKYRGDKAKQVDDTRSFYRDKARNLIDPESGLIRLGPKEDPDKYVREYNEILKQMQSDMVKISRGELPSWYEGEKKPIVENKLKPSHGTTKPQPMTDTEIRKILQDGGYASDAEAIKQFRKNNGL